MAGKDASVSSGIGCLLIGVAVGLVGRGASAGGTGWVVGGVLAAVGLLLVTSLKRCGVCKKAFYLNVGGGAEPGRCARCGAARDP